ncbi:MAG: BamA/TamA family outer membrane protein [Gemmatimonadetes bacterium]|nr:BamA/TamA family outer membrane protein [Gemmatimonadota bacterium]
MMILLPLLIAGAGDAADWIAEDFRGWKMSALEVRGAPGESEAIRRGLSLAEAAEFYPRALATDIARVRLYLARNGYPNTNITPEFEPDRGKRSVRVVLRVDPGLPVRVGKVNVEGLPEAEARTGTPQGLAEGAVFRESAAANAAGALERRLKERGYAFATVAWNVEPGNAGNVSVMFRVEAGDVFSFRDVSVEGISEDLEPVVKQTANMRPGARYHPVVVTEATTNLRLLGLFRLVRVRVDSVAPGEIDLVAELTERKPRSIDWGLGYWTDEGVRTRARWEHRNLFRRGRGGSIAGTFSRFRQSGRLSAWTHTLFGTRNYASVSMKTVREDEESYRLTETGGELAIRRRPSLFSTRTATLSVSDIRVEETSDDPDAFGGRDGLLTTLRLASDRNTADDRLYPAGGSRWETWTEWGLPGSFSESHFLAAASSGSMYRAAGGTVFAARLTLGAAGPTAGSDALLPNKRFYAGGAYSMRGFQRRKLGPKDSDGSPLGGEALLEASLEWRFPIAGIVGGALFVDSGQVWHERTEVRADEIEAAIGPSIVFRTPVGPVRGDWAYRLTNLDDTENRSVFHVIVGHPF